MAKTRRKKKRTHQAGAGGDGAAAPTSATTGEKGPPRSFVMRRGKGAAISGKALRELEMNLRQVMMPHTATRLRESKRNSLKDFVHVAGPLGVSHLVMLSATSTAAYVRFAKMPRGPTLTFRIHGYSLARDVVSLQKRPRAPASAFKTSPLVVLNNFNTGEEHLKLCTVMFQNMFPALNVATIKLSQCQRVALLHYDAATARVFFRHYAIEAAPAGVSKPIRHLLQKRQLPNLGELADVSEFMTRAGYASDSEVEDEASQVPLPQASKRAKPGRSGMLSAVKLHEIGPRMELELVKVEEGLCDGKVLYHGYIQRSEEEVAELQKRKDEQVRLKAERKKQQDENVTRKKAAEELKQKGKRKRGESTEQPEEENAYADVANDDDDDYDDDAEYYRKEVGEEPDDSFTRGLHKWRKPFQRQGASPGRRDEFDAADKDKAAIKRARPEPVGTRADRRQTFVNKKRAKLQERKGKGAGSRGRGRGRGRGR
eukprot:jgi/Chlat1/6812/Chrsp51S06510